MSDAAQRDKEIYRQLDILKRQQDLEHERQQSLAQEAARARDEAALAQQDRQRVQQALADTEDRLAAAEDDVAAARRRIANLEETLQERDKALESLRRAEETREAEARQAQQRAVTAEQRYSGLATDITQLQSELSVSRQEAERLLDNYTQLQGELQKATQRAVTAEVALREAEAGRRRAERQAEQESEERTRVEEQASELQKAVGELEGELRAASALAQELDEEKERKRAVDAELRRALDENAEMSKAAGGLRSAVASLQGDVASRDKMIASVERQRDDALQRLEAASQKLRSIEALVEESQHQAETIDRQIRQITSLETGLLARQTESDNLRAELRRLQSQHDREQASLQHQLRSARAELERREAELKARRRNQGGSGAGAGEGLEALVEQMQSELQASCAKLEDALNRLDEADIARQEAVRKAEDLQDALEEARAAQAEAQQQQGPGMRTPRDRGPSLERGVATPLAAARASRAARRQLESYVRGMGASFLLVTFGLERRLETARVTAASAAGPGGSLAGKDRELIDASLQAYDERTGGKQPPAKIAAAPGYAGRRVAALVDEVLNLRRKCQSAEESREDLDADLRSAKEHIRYLERLLTASDKGIGAPGAPGRPLPTPRRAARDLVQSLLTPAAAGVGMEVASGPGSMQPSARLDLAPPPEASSPAKRVYGATAGEPSCLAADFHRALIPVLCPLSNPRPSMARRRWRRGRRRWCQPLLGPLLGRLL